MMYQPIENWISLDRDTSPTTASTTWKGGIERLAAGFGEMRATPRRTEPTEARARRLSRGSRLRNEGTLAHRLRNRRARAGLGGPPHWAAELGHSGIQRGYELERQKSDQLRRR